MSLKQNRKGMAQNTALIAFFIGMVSVGVIIGIGVFILATLGNSVPSTAANTSIQNFITMFTNFTTQLGTVGTLGGVLLILVLVAFTGLAGYGYGKNKGYF